MTSGRVLRFPLRPISSEDGQLAASRVLATPIPERLASTTELQLAEPETLLALCGRLRDQLETCPATVRDEAEYLYRFVEKPKRSIGLFDEREYFLGESALIAGTACRVLSRRDEARRWFDRAEAAFRHTVSAVAEWSRIAYQRFALRVEERQFEDVLELLPSLIEGFRKLEMTEDALKCRFLEGIALMETDQLAESIVVFRDLCDQARKLGSEKLAATASYNLVQLYGMLGQPEEALLEANQTLPLLRRLDNRVGIGKLQWGLGGLLRSQRRYLAAIEAYRSAQEEFERIGMRADVAALQLVVADLLLEVGQDTVARREVLAALPVIDELKMVPEGVAALSLLRESLDSRINRQALRDLHGYFEELAQ